ncbi:MAG TPA: YdeI/OmpD-associated family protein [Alphaproteobacteria bacterium]|nr:YdeI/OmpD-associated family protein [Alphaproteobacteria bacterium]
MPSPTYKLFARAMAERKQVICSYDGYRRELCPIVLGHSKGREVALTYQFAGGSKSGLPVGGDWKCLELAKASAVALRDGPWHAGSKHQQRQSCVEIVDLDVNPDSPYAPKRSLESSPHPLLRFRSKIEINNINPYVLIDAKRAARLKKGWRKPLPVRVRVNGKPDAPWRINAMPIGDGSFYLYLHGDVRKASRTKVGDVVDVEVQFDDEYKSGPAHPIPSWFSEALERDKAAKRGWEALIPSRRKEILRYFSQLKSPEARARNLHKVLHVLAGGEARFMARDWNKKGDS